jgi:serine/threonine-protein kinase RsbW
MAITMALTLPGDMRAPSHARSLVDLLLSRFDVAGESRDDLVLMIAEACANAVIHAQPAGDIDLHISVDDHICVMSIGNNDVDLHHDRLPTQPPDAMAEHGRGMSIISALADVTRIVHERSGRVVLLIIKHIVRNSGQP